MFRNFLEPHRSRTLALTDHTYVKKGSNSEWGPACNFFLTSTPRTKTRWLGWAGREGPPEGNKSSSESDTDPTPAATTSARSPGCAYRISNMLDSLDFHVFFCRTPPLLRREVLFFFRRCAGGTCSFFLEGKGGKKKWGVFHAEIWWVKMRVTVWWLQGKHGFSTWVWS